MTGDNKPSQSAIDHALGQIFGRNRLEELKWLCEESTTKPSQEIIEVILKKAHTYPLQWDFVDYLCFLNSENKPRQPAIDGAMKDAADWCRWDLVKKIGLMTGDNKPSQSAIDHALGQTFGRNRLEELKWLCEESTTKPSQKTIENILRKAHTYPLQWDFVDYLCFLNSENKPSQMAIDGALKEAANYEKWDLVKKIGLMTGDNKPSQSAINHALGQTFGRKRLEELKWLCEESTTKPSQETIENILRKAHTYPPQWDFVDYLCFLNSENKPSQPAIDGAIKDAADWESWDLVKKIGLMTGNNKPSQFAINHALRQTFGRKRLEELKWLCEESTTKPSQKTIENILRKAHTYPLQWDFVDYLCFLNSENKPSQMAIDGALKEAADWESWDLVKKIGLMTGNNKPSQSAIDHALGQTFGRNRFEELKWLCEENTTRPSQEAIEVILKKAHTYPHKWDFVDYLCFLNSENKPSQPAIDGAMKEAADYEKWDLVNKIFQIESDYKPSQSAIDYVLKQAARSNQLKLVQNICGFPAELCPNSEAVSQAFIAAAGFGSMDVVLFFSNMETENKPLPEAYSDAIYAAADSGRLRLVQYFCQLKTANRPDQTLIGQVLIAASPHSLSVSQFLLSESNPIKPEKKDVAEAFVEAISNDHMELVAFFIDPENKIQLDQETFDKGLLAAVKVYYNVPIIKQLIVLASQEGIDKALNKAKMLGNGRINNVYDCLLSAKNETIQTTNQLINQPQVPQANTDSNSSKNKVNYAAQMSKIKAEAVRGIFNYITWSHGRNTMRGDNGFFTWARHGKAGRDRALALNGALIDETTLDGVTQVIERFLNDPNTRYNNHSLSNFLLDELRTVEDSPWWVEPAPSPRG